jgi:hypothetical protein
MRYSHAGSSILVVLLLSGMSQSGYGKVSSVASSVSATMAPRLPARVFESAPLGAVHRLHQSSRAFDIWLTVFLGAGLIALQLRRTQRVVGATRVVP